MEMYTENEAPENNSGSKPNKIFNKTTKQNSIIALLILLAIFIITRTFWLWFWKINALEHSLELMQQELQSITQILQSIDSKTP